MAPGADHEVQVLETGKLPKAVSEEMPLLTPYQLGPFLLSHRCVRAYILQIVYVQRQLIRSHVTSHTLNPVSEA